MKINQCAFEIFLDGSLFLGIKIFFGFLSIYSLLFRCTFYIFENITILIMGELEQLVNQPELVAPIIYENPTRSPQVFYDFVKETLLSKP